VLHEEGFDIRTKLIRRENMNRIRPLKVSSDYLEFECDCGTRADIISARGDSPKPEFDLRGMGILRINLECPKCKTTDSYKVNLVSVRQKNDK
jgi:hypothetical protein